MEALLAIGGAGPERGVLASRLPSFGLICAADSGLDLLASWGVKPDIVVGDLDSVSPGALAGALGVETLRFSPYKDESDTELGLRVLKERGADHVVIAGGGEGRLDHLLAIRTLFERERHPAEWHTAHESLRYLASGERLDLATVSGEIISVFPLAPGASGMESGGLEWPLHGLVWKAGDCGLSNVATGTDAWIQAGEGNLLVIRVRGERSPL